MYRTLNRKVKNESKMFHSAFCAEDSGNWQKNNCRGFYFMLQVNKPDFVMFVLFFSCIKTKWLKILDGLMGIYLQWYESSVFFECECDLIGRVCTQMCGINTVDNWILQMNYLNVVTNRIMSLADVFNTPLTLRWKKKSYKNKYASLHWIF